LAEFCQQYETVELWFDSDPNTQLRLVWLLDYFRSYPEAAARLKLRLVIGGMIGLERLGKRLPPAVNVTESTSLKGNSRRRARPGKPIGRRRRKVVSICSART
jgi:hypothetical protein